MVLYTFVAKETHSLFCKFYFQKAQSGELQYSGAHTRQGYLGVQRKGQNKFGIYWTYSNVSLCIANSPGNIAKFNYFLFIIILFYVRRPWNHLDQTLLPVH